MVLKLACETTVACTNNTAATNTTDRHVTIPNLPSPQQQEILQFQKYARFLVIAGSNGHHSKVHTLSNFVLNFSFSYCYWCLRCIQYIIICLTHANVWESMGKPCLRCIRYSNTLSDQIWQKKPTMFLFRGMYTTKLYLMYISPCPVCQE